MTKLSTFDLTAEHVAAFLKNHSGKDVDNLSLLGQGAWSRCFGFRVDEQDLVIRFGNYVEDFQKDRFAHTFASTALPIPEVLEIGKAFSGYYAISTRVYGKALETLNSGEWKTVVPSLIGALEAMRCADLPPDSGIGGWHGDGKASGRSWRERLLSVKEDNPTDRGFGWTKKLATSARGWETFKKGYALLEELATEPIQPSLVHGDLINRNVFVDRGKLSGVFDWGCSVYGDHLYDLAWFEFWSPWYPELDINYLRCQLEQHWRQIGFVPKNKETRLKVCYLHIGLEHLAYNAHLEDWKNLDATVKRMQELVDL